MHVKSNSTCKEDVFISTGLGKVFKWLYLKHREWPIVKFVESIEKSGVYSVGTPYTSECILAATKNIFGRLVNGMKECDCESGTFDTNDIKGNFIHIEQSFHLVENLNFWRKVFSYYL